MFLRDCGPYFIMLTMHFHLRSATSPWENNKTRRTERKKGLQSCFRSIKELELKNTNLN
uniref:Uncharacterized protein n=1 Tax=Rhizophora mucronata TaxID=61149 RepID=A0A2P2PMS5_RHIMU